MPTIKSTDGVEIYYEVRGEGPALAQISGAYATIAEWEYYAEQLQRERTVVMHDPRGRGKSGKPHDASAYSWKQKASDVVAILDELGLDRVDLFGYSQGAGVSFALISGHGDRLRSVVAGGGSPPLPGYNELSPDALTQAKALREGGLEGVAAGFDNLWRALGPEYERFKDWWQAYRDRAAAGDIEAYAAEMEGLATPEGMHLPDAGPPTLLFAGSNDQFPAALGKHTSERLDYVTYRELPGLDHMQAIMRDDLVLPIVREFWSGLA